MVFRQGKSERQTDKQTDRQTETEIQTDRYSDTGYDPALTCRCPTLKQEKELCYAHHVDRQTETESDRWRQTDRQTETDRQRQRATDRDRQTDRQIFRH